MTVPGRARPIVVDPATWRGRLLVPVLTFTGLVTAMVSSLGAPLVPTIADEYDVSLGTAQWTLTLTLLMGAISAPVVGRISDGPRRRTVIVGTLAIVVAGSVLAALPTGVFALLLTGRGMQGMGLGLVPAAMGVARDHLAPERARAALATLSVTNVVGVGLGYPLTGIIADHLDWKYGFWLAAAMAVAAMGLAALVVPSSSHRSRRPFDLPGTALLAIGLVGLLLAISNGEQWGWSSPRLIIVVTVSLLVLFGWVVYELRARLPLIDLRLVRNRAVLVANVSSMLAGVGVYMLSSMIIRYVQTPTTVSYGLGASVVAAGFVLVPMSASSYLSSKAMPFLNRRFTPAQTLPLGMFAFAVALAYFAVSRDHLWEAFVIMGIGGVGVGCSFAVTPRMIISAVPADQTSSALAMNQVLRTIGFCVGSALAATILTAHTPAGEEYPLNRGYTVGAIVAIGCCLVAAITCIVLAAGGRVPSTELDEAEELEVTESVDGAIAGGFAFEPDGGRDNGRDGRRDRDRDRDRDRATVGAVGHGASESGAGSVAERVAAERVAVDDAVTIDEGIGR